MIQADTVKTVFQGEDTLDLMGLDHAVEDVCDGQRVFPRGAILQAEIVGDGKNAAEIIGRMSPFGGQPGVVEVQPAHQRADIECRLHRVQPVVGAGHPRPVRHFGSGHHRPQHLCAGGKFERHHSAGQGIQQAVKCSTARLLACGLAAQYIIGNILQQHIGRGSFGVSCAHI